MQPRAVLPGRTRRPLAEGDHAPPSFAINGAETVFVDLGGPARPAGPNPFIDIRVDTGSQQGCIRVPLTAAGDQTHVARATSPPWSLSLGAAHRSPAGAARRHRRARHQEVRALRPLGPVRGFFGFTLGVAGCRGADCPPESPQQRSEDETTTGVFGHSASSWAWTAASSSAGAGRWPRRWAATSRSSTSARPTDWPGDQSGAVAGPFASLTLFGLGGDDSAIPGFVPEARRLRSGPELFVHRLTAFGRGPTESAWVMGFGWRIEGTRLKLDLRCAGA